MTSPVIPGSTGLGTKRLNQHVGALIVSLGGFAMGVSLGWNSSGMEVLRKNSNASGIGLKFVGGCVNLGASIGSILVVLGPQGFSRISKMLLAVPLFVIGWSFLCFAKLKMTEIAIGRAICGVCCGGLCATVPIYIGEIAEKEARGWLLAYFQLLNNCGIMYAFVVAHALEERQSIWRYSLLCLIPCLAIALVKLLPESPLHYLTKGDESRAKSSLSWYSSGEHRIEEEELEELKRLVAGMHSRKWQSKWKLLRNRRIWRTVLAGLLIAVTQQICGVNAIIFQARTIFDLAGSGELTGSQLTLLVAAVQIFSCFAACGLLDIVARRILLSVSCALMGLFLILLGWFFALRSKDPEYDDTFFWMPPTWVTLLFVAYNLGVGPMYWVILGDSFPVEVKAQAVAGIVSFGWFLSFLLTFYFIEIVLILGPPTLMYIFASLCWASALFCSFLANDNKGKSLGEIQNEFGFDSVDNGTNRTESTR